MQSELTGILGNIIHGPIDHFFINGLTPVSYKMITDGYGCAKMSDHFPILLDVRVGLEKAPDGI